jgi:hypothetical protein
MVGYIPEKRITAKEAMNHPFFNDIFSMKGENDTKITK